MGSARLASTTVPAHAARTIRGLQTLSTLCNLAGLVRAVSMKRDRNHKPTPSFSVQRS
jgi:hypothetical protein